MEKEDLDLYLSVQYPVQCIFQINPLWKGEIGLPTKKGIRAEQIRVVKLPQGGRTQWMQEKKKNNNSQQPNPWPQYPYRHLNATKIKKK